jgi:hypothetical protein
MSKSSAKTVQRALNRLAIACHDEVLALDSAARNFGGERGARLRHQSSRRGIFLGDLRAGVLALKGVPAEGASYRAQLSDALRSVAELVTGPQQRAAYVNCARMTARTARAYTRALGLELPADVRFGLVRQQSEIDTDAQELRWLRWGGSLSQAQSSSDPSGLTTTAVVSARLTDRRALDVWEQDGGATPA